MSKMQKIPVQQKMELMQSTALILAPLEARVSLFYGQLPRHDVTFVEYFLAHADNHEIESSTRKTGLKCGRLDWRRIFTYLFISNRKVNDYECSDYNKGCLMINHSFLYKS